MARCPQGDETAWLRSEVHREALGSIHLDRKRTDRKGTVVTKHREVNEEAIGVSRKNASPPVVKDSHVRIDPDRSDVEGDVGRALANDPHDGDAPRSDGFRKLVEGIPE
jgi:hypothetical protein